MKNSKAKTRKHIPNWVSFAVILAVVIVVVVLFIRAQRPKQIAWTKQARAEHQRFIEEVRSGKRKLAGRGPMHGRPA